MITLMLLKGLREKDLETCLNSLATSLSRVLGLVKDKWFYEH
jgi:hypothetical protein